MAVGIVLVSHSARLAEAVVEMAMQMIHDDAPPVALAAGMPDGGLGTDATRVMSAIEEVDQGDGVAVFVDVGSALMSAELGAELYGERPDIRVLAAPFVEGVLAAMVRSATDASLDEVAAEALSALRPKLAALGTADEMAAEPESHRSAEVRAEATLINDTGLHARPAAMFVAEAKRHNADVLVSKGVQGPVPAKSSIGLATLGARKGDTLHLEASGPDAQAAIDALVRFIESGFGE